MKDENKKCQFCGEEIKTEASKSCDRHETLPPEESLRKKETDTSPESTTVSSVKAADGNLLLLLANFILSLAVIFFAGWIYVKALSVPVLWYFMPMVYGVFTGGLAWSMCIQKMHSKKIGVIIAVIAVSVFMAVYASWVWQLGELYESFCFSPGEMFSRIGQLSRVRQISLMQFGKNTDVAIPIRGTFLVIGWFLEIGIIAASAAFPVYDEMKKAKNAAMKNNEVSDEA